MRRLLSCVVLLGASGAFAQSLSTDPYVQRYEQEEINRKNQRAAKDAQDRARRAEVLARDAQARLDAIEQREADAQRAQAEAARRAEVERQQQELARQQAEYKAKQEQTRRDAIAREQAARLAPRPQTAPGAASVLMRQLSDGRYRVSAGGTMSVFATEAEALAYIAKVKEASYAPPGPITPSGRTTTTISRHD